jgi:hypothetical protein
MGVLKVGLCWPIGSNMALLKVLLLVLVLLAGNDAWASDARIRLGFLLNFARFTEWPATALAVNAPLQICLAPGDAGMAQELSMLTNQQVQGRTVLTRLISASAEAGNCQLLYLPAELPGPVEPYLRTAERSAMLTVSDHPDFVESGGIIGLTPSGGRYRFDINLQAAKRVNLRLDVQLLKLARSVK